MDKAGAITFIAVFAVVVLSALGYGIMQVYWLWHGRWQSGNEWDEDKDRPRPKK